MDAVIVIMRTLMGQVVKMSIYKAGRSYIHIENGEREGEVGRGERERGKREKEREGGRERTLGRGVS